MKRRSVFALAICALAQLLFTTSASAADYTWRNVNASFHEQDRWNPIGVPGVNDRAIFNRTSVTSSVEVVIGAPTTTAQLSVLNGNFIFEMLNQEYSSGATKITNDPVRSSNLTIRNGTLIATSLDVTNTLNILHLNGGYDSFLVVDGVGANVRSDTLSTSKAPAGEWAMISVRGGGKLKTTGQATLNSRVSVTGTGSTWEAGDIVGTSVVSVTNGGQLNANTLSTSVYVDAGSVHYRDSININTSATLLNGATITGENAQSLPVDFTVGPIGTVRVNETTSITASMMNVRGRLFVSDFATINSDVTFDSGGRMFAENAVINGAMTLNSGSRMEMNGLTVDSLTWNAGSTLRFPFSGESNVVLGALEMGSGVHKIEITSTAKLGLGGVTFLTANGGITGFESSQFMFTDVLGNVLGPEYVVKHIGNSLVLMVPVPEPASIALSAIGALGAALIVRRRTTKRS